LFALLVLVSLVISGCAKEEPAAPATGGGVGDAETETVVLLVEGMETPNCCDVAVKGMLSKVPGVVDCVISLEDKTATVTVEKGTDPQTLVAGITGYKATVKE
jgi:copper chaperone CopZ